MRSAGTTASRMRLTRPPASLNAARWRACANWPAKHSPSPRPSPTAGFRSIHTAGSRNRARSRFRRHPASLARQLPRRFPADGIKVHAGQALPGGSLLSRRRVASWALLAGRPLAGAISSAGVSEVDGRAGAVRRSDNGSGSEGSSPAGSVHVHRQPGLKPRARSFPSVGRQIRASRPGEHCAAGAGYLSSELVRGGFRHTAPGATFQKGLTPTMRLFRAPRRGTLDVEFVWSGG